MKRLYLPHLIGLCLIASLIGLFQSFAFSYASLKFDDLNDYLFQSFSGTLDFVFPFLFLMTALFLIPRDIESGFIRQLMVVPESRSRLFANYYVVMYLLNLLSLTCYLIAVIVSYRFFFRTGPAHMSFAAWTGAVVTAALTFLFIQSFFLLFYLATRNSFLSLIISGAALFSFEIIAGFSDLQAFLPTTNAVFFVEWFNDFWNGFRDQTTALVMPLAILIIYNVVLYGINRFLFRRLNLLYANN
ncbi:MAG TPA: ABC transporter permease [Verrucomicrobiae bacterium]|jgi:hypothetical protein|nr:ABC transporter permease [Verrucomicrobiae bacterium]